MINFIYSIGVICFGATLIYIGALSLIGSILPSELAKQVGYAHGKYVRNLIYPEKGQD